MWVREYHHGVKGALGTAAFEEGRRFSFFVGPEMEVSMFVVDVV